MCLLRRAGPQAVLLDSDRPAQRPSTPRQATESAFDLDNAEVTTRTRAFVWDKFDSVWVNEQEWVCPLGERVEFTKRQSISCSELGEAMLMPDLAGSRYGLGSAKATGWRKQCCEHECGRAHLSVVEAANLPKASNVKHQRARATASRGKDELSLRALRCMR